MASDQINRWLTFASNIAVLIGLVFVGFEVRNSSRAVTAESANAVADGFNQFNYLVASDADIARIEYLAFRAPDKLTDPETIRASAIMRGLFNQYQQVHTLYRSGVLTEEQWEIQTHDIYRLMQTPGGEIFVRNARFLPSFLSDVRRYASDTNIDTASFGRGMIEFD